LPQVPLLKIRWHRRQSSNFFRTHLKTSINRLCRLPPLNWDRGAGSTGAPSKKYFPGWTCPARRLPKPFPVSDAIEGKCVAGREGPLQAGRLSRPRVSRRSVRGFEQQAVAMTIETDFDFKTRRGHFRGRGLRALIALAIVNLPPAMLYAAGGLIASSILHAARAYLGH
jgi:hypothetical protein